MLTYSFRLALKALLMNHVCACVCVSLATPYAAESMETRREHYIPWLWSYLTLVLALNLQQQQVLPTMSHLSSIPSPFLQTKHQPKNQGTKAENDIGSYGKCKSEKDVIKKKTFLGW